MADATESGVPALPVETHAAKKPKPLLVALLVVIFLAGCAVGGVWVFNETTLQKPLQKVLIADPRNHAVTAKAHLDGWVDTHSVVFDLADVTAPPRSTFKPRPTPRLVQFP